VVVDDFNIACLSALPAEADAILVVDADAVLSLAVADQFLQVIAGWDTKIIQRLCSVQEQ